MRPLALSPHGVLYVDDRDVDEATHAEVDVGVAARIDRAFAKSASEGLFHLGAVEVETTLPPTYAFFRDVARDLVALLASDPDLEERRAAVVLAPSRERLEPFVLSRPPMRGGEYVTVDTLERLWLDALSFFRADIKAYRGTVGGYLHDKSPVWNVVGRIFFHLAENKQSEATPFAFLATVATRVSATAKPQHRPLGKALETSANADDRRAMLALLAPVARASEKSALIKSMVDDGDLYHPLAWTAEEAYAFLQEVPALEASGVVVRVPNWWSARRTSRPQVSVTVGAAAPSKLGTSALLDFAVDVTLDGEVLSRAELHEILRQTTGLSLVKGRWVEIDRERLTSLLDHWKTAQKSASNDGFSFLEAMRLLAGARDPKSLDAGGVLDGDGWVRVQAGAWLGSVLDGLRSPEGLASIDPGAELRAELRPYQRVGVQWLAWLQAIGLGGCLADDMGLGKTIQVLALLLLIKKKSTEKEDTSARRSASLLVVPASLIGNWTSEAARFAPSLDVLVAHPSALPAGGLAALSQERVDRADLVLTTYGAIERTPWIGARTWELVVLDEAQAIKNPAAKQTRAVKALRSRTRLALTGTPVENRLGDLWSLFDFLAPGLLGTAAEFGRVSKALGKTRTEGGDLGNAYRPLRELVRPYILRRLKTDKRVIADLPDKTEVRAFCPLTRVQAALYAEAVEDLRRKVDDVDGIERRGAILASLLRFKQICNHPSQWLGDGGYDPKASGKLARLRELCEPIAERQEKVLIFTQFREMTEPLARFLAGVFGRPGLVLSGTTAVKDRKKLVDEFQSELGPPFFVLSLKAGGTGLTLTAASHVIHFDRWWNPAVENQATDRAYRIGQKKGVLVHKLVCRGTVEERIDALIAGKQGLSDAVIDGGGEAILTELSNEALMKMVSLDLNAALEETAPEETE